MADKILVVDDTTGKTKRSTVNIGDVGGSSSFATDIDKVLTNENGDVLVNASGNVLINGT